MTAEALVGAERTRNSFEENSIMQTLGHPALEFVIALLALAAMAFAIEQIGLRIWIAWLNRHLGQRTNSGSKEFWRAHQ